MNSEFYILFKGDLVGSENKKGVISDFAELFSAPINDIEKFFTGNAFFLHLCDDLSAAKQYHDAFSKIGARAYIIPPAIVNEIKPDYEYILNRKFVLCQTCGTTQATGTQCVNCYSNILKFLKNEPHTSCENPPLPSSLTTPQETISAKGHSRSCTVQKKQDDIPEQVGGHGNIQEPYAEKAKKLFQISSILMLAALTLDEMFAKYLEFHPDIFWQYNIDGIGILPYIAITLLIVKACHYYVESKSMNPLLCFLGLANIIGIGILLLIPDKKRINRKQQYFSKVRISAIIMLSIIACWATVSYFEKNKISLFLNSPLPFSDRPDYNALPSLTIDSTIFLQKLRENNQLLDAYIDDAYQILTENDLKMSQREKIADNIFRSVSNMTIWMNNYIYLYYLDADHFIDNEYLYADSQFILNTRYIKESVKKRLTAIYSRNKQLDDPIVNRANRDWGQSYFRENDGYKTELFQKEFINRIFVPLTNGNTEAQLKILKQQFNRSSDKLFSEVNIENNLIFLRLKDNLGKDLSGKTMLFGIWQDTQDSHDGKYKFSYLKFALLGGDLSPKFIPSYDYIKSAL